MLRFSVDFLWISVSEWTVRFSLCLEQKCLQASATHLDTALTLWFMWNDLESISVGSFYPSAQQINQFLHVPSNHGSKILRQTDEEAQTSQVGFSGSFSKESRACPVCPRTAARHSSALGRAGQHHLDHTTQLRVLMLMLTLHRLKKDGWRLLRNQNHI